jgi:glyoxylase-like metal-dependent hydrolase (beta-lactamase superfamily II)
MNLRTLSTAVAVRLSLASFALVGSWSIGQEAHAQADSPVTKINAEAAASPIDVQHLRGDVSALIGSGGNIVVLESEDGKLLVDTGIAVSRKRLSAALADIGASPPRYAINTHWHWDHTDGNEWVHQAGATIIAHENSLRHVSETTRVDDWNYTFPPLPSGARPTVIVTSGLKLDFGGETVVINDYGPAHTDGDLSVYFVDADVLVTGDTYWNGLYPFIDSGAGGGIDGMIRAANTNIEQTTDATIIVPGHGPVSDRAHLIAYRDMLVAVRDNVAALKSRGKSLDEVVAARPTQAYDAEWGRFVIGPALFTRLVYRGL